MPISKGHPYILVKSRTARRGLALLYKSGMPSLRTIGERLKYARVDLRQERGLPRLSQEAVGRAIGVSKMSVSDWENDKYAPSLPQQRPLATFLAVPVGWLIHGEGLPERIGNVSLHPLLPGGRTVPIVDPARAARDVDAAIAQSTETLRVLSDVGQRSFSVTIWDQSNAPELQVGHAVVVDRNCIPQPGDICFAAVGEDERPVLGELVEALRDGGTVRLLRTLNDKWADVTLSDGDTIHGPVVEHTRFLRNRR